MKFSILLGGSKKNKKAGLYTGDGGVLCGRRKEELCALRDPSSCKVKNICGKTELEPSVGFQGNDSPSERGEERRYL